MAEDIELPAVGPVKRQWVYVGGALVAGILIYAYWQRARAGGPAAPEFVDPAAVAGGPTSGSTTPGISFTPPSPADPSTLPPATNGEWTKRAVDYMQNIGYDPQLVAGVLGKYLAHQTLTPSEQDIVRTVEGVMGKPPVGQYAIVPVPNPPPNPAPDTGGGRFSTQNYFTVGTGWTVHNTVGELQKQGWSGTWGDLVALNPEINGNIAWDPNGHREFDHFKSSATYRLR